MIINFLLAIAASNKRWLLESSIIFKECLQALSIEKVLKHKHKCTDYA